MVAVGAGGLVLRGRRAATDRATTLPAAVRRLDHAGQRARDPGLPGVVAVVAGVPVPATEVTSAEGLLAARGLGSVGGDTTRRAALRLIISQIMIARAAARDGFVASASLAQRQAADAGMPATARVIAGYEYGQLQADLEHKVMAGRRGQFGPAAWDAYVRWLVARAPVTSHVRWWSARVAAAAPTPAPGPRAARQGLAGAPPTGTVLPPPATVFSPSGLLGGAS